MNTTLPEPDQELLEYIKIQCHKCEERLELTHVLPLSKVECTGCSTTLRVPLKVGDLLLEQLINSDENFKFYRGTDLRLNRPAVIKVINKELTTPGEIYSFGIGTFDHPGISSIYSVNIIDDTYYLITENIIGQTLDHFLCIEDYFDKEDILGIAQQVSEALKAASDKNIHHGHLSLDAIWVSNEGDCKVADFGIRKRLYTQDLSGSEKKIKNSVYFSGKDLSPEQTDLYSFGVCLHRLAAGKFPVNGTAQLESSILDSGCNEIIKYLLESKVSTFKELTELLEEDLTEVEEEIFLNEEPEPTAVKIKTQNKSVKLSSQSQSHSRPASTGVQIKTINSLKKKLLVSRLFFLIFLFVSFVFATSRYMPKTPVGRFSESILKNTLDKGFIDASEKDPFDVIDILDKK